MHLPGNCNLFPLLTSKLAFSCSGHTRAFVSTRLPGRFLALELSQDKLNLHWLTTSAMQVNGKIPWPLKLFVKPAVEQTSAFLDLPLEILCCICDQLPLSAKILLSHICKAMWYMLHSKCSFQLKAIVREDRFNTLTELGNLLPDNYHCIKCSILHNCPAYTTTIDYNP